MRQSIFNFVRFIACLIPVFIFSQSSFAVEYSWFYQGGPSSTVPARGVVVSSPSAACELAASHYLNNSYSAEYKSLRLIIFSATEHEFDCIAELTDLGNGSKREFAMGRAVRSGDECPNPDDTYNPDTGVCDKSCSPTEGQKLAAQGPLSPVLTDGDGVRNILPEPFSEACFDGCNYEVQSSFSDRLGCYLQSGSTTEGFCNYRVTGSGQSCPASNGVPAGGGDPLNPTPPPDDPDDPPTDPGCPPPYVWNGDFCQSDPDDDDGGDGPGDGDGGDGPGDGGGGGPGDGGGDGGGGDGPGDGDGDGDGSGDGGGDGDGDGSGDGGGGGGDGDGDCTGEDCGPGEGSGLTAPEAGTFDDAITEYEQKIADSLEDIKNKSGQFGDLIKQKLNVQLSSGNAILPCFDAVIMGENVGFCFSTYTEQLSILRALLLFLATVIALYIIFREDK